MNEKARKVRGYLAEHSPEALLADGLDDALVGVAEIPCHRPIAVYSRTGCVDALMSTDGMDYETALEFLEFNTFCAYVGDGTPAFIILADELDEPDELDEDMRPEVGDSVWWADPDEGLCSRQVTVKGIEYHADGTASITTADEGVIECPLSELFPEEPSRVH